MAAQFNAGCESILERLICTRVPTTLPVDIIERFQLLKLSTRVYLRKNVLIFNCALLALSLPAVAAELETTLAYFSYGQLEYVGDLDDAANKRLFDLYEKLPVKPKVLSIRSLGGEVNAGMALGSWIRAHKLNVKVMEYCLSSCANYVFPAGIQKIVSNFAVIAYHGGPGDPKKLKLDANAQGIYDALSPAEQKAFMDDIVNMAVGDGRREAEYFQHIGVRSDISSLGQEDQYEQFTRTKPGVEGWTYSIEGFAALGVGGISVINPPWKPGSVLDRWVFVTIPVGKQAKVKR